MAHDLVVWGIDSPYRWCILAILIFFGGSQALGGRVSIGLDGLPQGGVLRRPESRAWESCATRKSVS
jgi:hypothetical protein